MNRTWLPNRDSGLAAGSKLLQDNSNLINQLGSRPSRDLQTYKNSISQAFAHDMMTSTNVASGMHRLHPVEAGQFRRVRQEVTLVHNQPIGAK